MRLFLNELSVEKSELSISDIAEAVSDFLSERAKNCDVYRSVYISKYFSNKNVDVKSFTEAVQCLGRDKRILFYEWMQRGPFMEGVDSPLEDNLFYYGEFDVTELGLGFAGRQNKCGLRAGTFSPFSHTNSEFCIPNIQVLQGFIEEPIEYFDIENVFELDDLRKFFELKIETIERWDDLEEYSKKNFENLLFEKSCFSPAQQTPFSNNLRDRVIEILSILNSMMEEMQHDGSLSVDGLKLKQKYFVGGNALFSDESDNNKVKFRRDMTFDDPEILGKKIICFWHGKIQTPQFRVHFLWPVEKPFETMKIVYIGPKISKK